MNRTLVLPDDQLDNLCRRYQGGETALCLARELGVTQKTVNRLLQRAGVATRGRAEAYAARRGFGDSEWRTLHARYMAGESSVEIARGIGCHSSTLRNGWRRLGLEVRDASACHKLSASKMTAEQRAAMTGPAHAAVRGRKQTLAEKCLRAITREAAPPELTGAELRLHGFLMRLGVHVARERACGPYNIDFAVGHSIAVECFGGHWHASGRHAARHEQRVRYLLDSGWDVVVVWLDKRGHGGWMRALKNAVTDLKAPGRDPSALREYRVVGGNGDLVRLRADADHFPSKPAGELRRDDATGRYYRAG